MDKNRYKLTGIAAVALAVDFLFHTILLLSIEPGMGFKGMGDYFDPGLLIPALGSIPWQISNIFHMAAGILIPVIGVSLFEKPNTVLQSISDKIAIFCGILFFVVGVSGFAALNATKWLVEDRLEFVLTGFSIFRYTLLLSAVVSYALFIALLSRIGRKTGLLEKWFSYAGYLIALVLFAFLFIPVPVPLILFIWNLLFVIVLIAKKK